LVLGIALVLVVWLTYGLVGESPENVVAERAAEPEATAAAERPAGTPRTEESPATSESGADASPGRKAAPENLPAPATAAQLVRAQFAWGIKDKEPTAVIASPAILQSGNSVTLYFFSEFNGMQGRTVSHRWSRNGRVALIKDFQVAGEHWRVFSSKQLNTKLLGEWKVTIRDDKGENLGEFVLNVLKATKPSR
jgi:hypothetical protein